MKYIVILLLLCALFVDYSNARYSLVSSGKVVSLNFKSSLLMLTVPLDAKIIDVNTVKSLGSLIADVQIYDYNSDRLIIKQYAIPNQLKISAGADVIIVKKYGLLTHIPYSDSKLTTKEIWLNENCAIR